MQRNGESRWRPLELCWLPKQTALPPKGKEYPGLGYKRLRDKPPSSSSSSSSRLLWHSNDYQQLSLVFVSHVRFNAGVAAGLAIVGISHWVTTTELSKLDKKMHELKTEFEEYKKDAKTESRELREDVKTELKELRQDVAELYKHMKESMNCYSYTTKCHGRAKQLVVFFGAASIGTGGGWGADAVLRACCKAVQAQGLRPAAGRGLLVDEHRTTRVSPAVNGKQPCEEELDHEQHTRRAEWKPKQGSSQEATSATASEPEPNTPPPANRSKRTEAEQAAEHTQPTKAEQAAERSKGKAAKAKPAPQPGSWL
ncbi:hypothetical protein QJQ45_024440 [Haematococcus lacustris]|nr:hypothetical protein QJQ45_024440 [Haematococcus lacustris]